MTIPKKYSFNLRRIITGYLIFSLVFTWVFAGYPIMKIEKAPDQPIRYTVTRDIPVVQAATAGPTAAGTGSSATWSNPTYITANDTNRASVTPANTKILVGTQFGFNLPANAVSITVAASIKGYVATTSTANNRKENISVTKDGSAQCGNTTTITLPSGSGAEATVNTGALSGCTLTYSEVNASTFGVRLVPYQTSTYVHYVNYVVLAITYSLNAEPTGTWNSASQAANATGYVNMSFTVNDAEGANIKVKVEYTSDASCSSGWTDATIVGPTSATVTDPDYGPTDPGIDNNNAYQLGTAGGVWGAISGYGPNTITANWDSKSDVTVDNATYCLRITTNDGTSDQATPATQSFTLDNTAPAAGNLTNGGTTNTSVTLTFGVQSAEAHFSTYKIYYKQGTSGVTTSDTQQVDADLGSQTYNGTANTVVSGLSPNTAYVFNIWTYDVKGNTGPATEITVTTPNGNAPPQTRFEGYALPSQLTNGTGYVNINPRVSDDNGDLCKLKVEYTSDASCTSGWTKATLVGSSANAAYVDVSGHPDINNANAYQIGNNVGYKIKTASGENSLDFQWNAKTDAPSTDKATYCLRTTANDYTLDEDTPTTQTVLIDNVAVAAGNLTDGGRTYDTITLTYGSASTEQNFSTYRIYYKAGTSGVTESNTQHVDADLANISYNSTANTAVTSLNENTNYVFNIWTHDTIGNIGSATEINLKTRALATSTITNAVQTTDGTGMVVVSLTAQSADSRDTRAKLEYSSGSGCSGPWYTASIATTSPSGFNPPDTGGQPDVNNANAYALGSTATTRIKTSSGTVTGTFYWNSHVDVPSANGSYCLRSTVNDDLYDQVTPSTRVVEVDNVAPTAPGNLTSGWVAATSAFLTFGTESTDTHFYKYRIFYKQGASGVTTGDTEWLDTNLLASNYSGAAGSTLTGLSQGTQYVAKIWAYDTAGNLTPSASEVTFTTTYDGTPFVTTVMESGGDFANLTEWRDAMTDGNTQELDLTAATTKVFSHSGGEGTIPAQSVVTGSQSGATGVAVFTTSNQILIRSISGTFRRFENVGTDEFNYVTLLTNVGSPASLEVVIDGTWSAPETINPDTEGAYSVYLDLKKIISTPDHYMKIYTSGSARPLGTIGSSNYRLAKQILLGRNNAGVILDGLAFVNNVGAVSYVSGVNQFINYNNPPMNAHYEIQISNSVYQGREFSFCGGDEPAGQLISQAVIDNATPTFPSGFSITSKVYNNIVYDNTSIIDLYCGGNVQGVYFQNSLYPPLQSAIKSYVYNNTFYNVDYPIHFRSGGDASSASTFSVKNNFAQSQFSTEYYFETFADPSADSDYNISAHNLSGYTAPGAHSLQSVTPTFVDLNGRNLHLDLTDQYAINAGTNLSADTNVPFDTDIDGATRCATWDIGADEVATESYPATGTFTSASIDLSNYSTAKNKNALRLTWKQSIPTNCTLHVHLQGTNTVTNGNPDYSGVSQEGPYSGSGTNISVDLTGNGNLQNKRFFRYIVDAASCNNQTPMIRDIALYFD